MNVKTSVMKTEAKYNLFFRIYIVFSLMMIVDFFVTSNPYSAFHAGKAGVEYSIVDDNFFITPAYLVLLSLLFALTHVKTLILDYKILFAMCVLLISGIYTGRILTNPITYIYDFLSFVLISSLAITDFKNLRNNDDINCLGKFAKILTVLLILGLCLAILFPNRYGLLPFGFSRESRGEVTFWNVTAMTVLYPTVAILVYRKYKNLFYICLSLIMSIVIFSTASRAPAIISVLPFFVIALIHTKFIHKVLFLGISLTVFFFFKETIIDFINGGSSGYSEDMLNGRFDLWIYHWNAFIQNPFLGSGAFFQEAAYSGNAVSEIGALAWFSTNGIIFGFFLMVTVARATVISVQLLLNTKKITDTELFFSLIMLSMLPNLMQSYSRILSLEDMIFWFSVFFLNAYRRPLFPYTRFI